MRVTEHMRRQGYAIERRAYWTDNYSAKYQRRNDGVLGRWR